MEFLLLIFPVQEMHLDCMKRHMVKSTPKLSATSPLSEAS